MKTKILSAVPTNIITGFLGVGKTTAILHLLKHKPESERWAILVNEFGEIGVDGSLLEGQGASQKTESEQSLFIKEVPGGCMCCTAGLPMQIALNQLLAAAKPDRLLIEPTGLGHPIEVIQTLSTKHYQEILKIQKVMTFVDARKLTNPRYTNHKTFNQQIEVADLVVGNKSDLYRDEDKNNLISYSKKYGFGQDRIKFVQHGEINFDWLSGQSKHVTKEFKAHESSHHHKSTPGLSEQELPESGFLCARNQGDGYRSEGWRITPEITFDYEKLYSWMNSLDVERLKAVFITTKGIFGFNLSEGTLSQVDIDDCMESRVEVIYNGPQVSFERDINQCIVEED